MQATLRTKTTAFVAGHRRNVALGALARGARAYIHMFENFNYECDSNGERWLLHQLARVDPMTIFDVGANVGDWTAAARVAAPRSDVHSFELVPRTADGLDDRFASDPSVHVVPVGLLDRTGHTRVKFYPETTTVSSIYDFPHSGTFEWVDGSLMRGDDYCAAAGIDRVDFLKIDAEGADHQVLRGFSRMLASGAIKAVQFEYGRSSIMNGFLLRDFYELLLEYNMVIGKLYPNYVAFKEYDMYRDEDFLGPNFVAVHRDHRRLLPLLAST